MDSDSMYKAGGEQDHTPNPWPSGFESSMQVGDYAMPRAGKTKDYTTPADRKANPGVK